MYASAPRQHEYAVQIRWVARTMATCVVGLWATFVVAEFCRASNTRWPADLIVQAGLLGVVFAGYAIGWRKEIIGGWMAILGTATFALVLAITHTWPYQAFELAWFAVPGVLYLMARHCDRRSAEPLA